MAETLADVVRQLRTYGYSSQVIREHLLAQGYQPAEIDTALVVTTKNKTLFVILGIIFLGVLATVLIALLTTPATPARKALPLQVDVQFPKVEFSPGEPIVFRLNVAARAGQQATFGFEMHALPSRKRVHSIEESKALIGSVSKVVSIEPPVLPEGTYVVTAIVRTPKDSASALANIRIKVPTKTENITETTDIPTNNSELTSITDITIKENPVKTTLLVNAWSSHFFRILNERNVVLLLETKTFNIHTSPSGTVLEVSPSGQGSVQIALTPNDLEIASEKWCFAAPKPAQDACLQELAMFTRKYETCKGVKDIKLRDECFVSFALEGNYAVCEFLSDPNWQEQCTSLAEQPTYSRT